MTDTAPEPFSLVSHPSRDSVLGEVHARPFHPISTPRRFLHFAFMTGGTMPGADRSALAAFCTARGLPVPSDSARHHYVVMPQGALRWELHAEFTTYTWELEATSDVPFTPSSGVLAYVMKSLPQPGPLLAAIDLHLMKRSPDLPEMTALFDSASLAVSRVDNDGAVIASDFRADPAGFVRILMVDDALTPARAGALSQRLLEIETYRTLALLGLPEAQALAPRVKFVEDQLTRIAKEMMTGGGLDADHRLLDELTALAATVEADAAASGYRFAASRAYDEIVRQRLQVIRERAVEGWTTFADFLSRRMSPAMRTCAVLEKRQAQLAEKLSRSANLLRTRVDVEIERQNRDLLSAMNDRTRLQLRLQQTVEGLSVAAISYYVIGLATYLFKGAKDVGWLPIDPGTATAAAVPVVVIVVALIVRRIRRGNDGD
jgi:uncharacterized membrane-anchored protein